MIFYIKNSSKMLNFYLIVDDTSTLLTRESVQDIKKTCVIRNLVMTGFNDN